MRVLLVVLVAIAIAAVGLLFWLSSHERGLRAQEQANEIVAKLNGFYAQGHVGEVLEMNIPLMSSDELFYVAPYSHQQIRSLSLPTHLESALLRLADDDRYGGTLVWSTKDRVVTVAHLRDLNVRANWSVMRGSGNGKAIIRIKKIRDAEGLETLVFVAPPE